MRSANNWAKTLYDKWARVTLAEIDEAVEEDADPCRREAKDRPRDRAGAKETTTAELDRTVDVEMMPPLTPITCELTTRPKECIRPLEAHLQCMDGELLMKIRLGLTEVTRRMLRTFCARHLRVGEAPPRADRQNAAQKIDVMVPDRHLEKIVGAIETGSDAKETKAPAVGTRTRGATGETRGTMTEGVIGDETVF